MLNAKIKKADLLISSAIVLSIFALTTLVLVLTYSMSYQLLQNRNAISISFFVTLVSLVFFLISLNIKDTESESTKYTVTDILILLASYYGYAFVSFMGMLNLFLYSSDNQGVGGFFLIAFPTLIVMVMFPIAVCLNILAGISLILQAVSLKNKFFDFLCNSCIHIFGIIISIAGCMWYSNHIGKLIR